MRALFAMLLRQWLEARAERRRRLEIVTRWRNPREDDQVEQVRDRILVAGFVSLILVAGSLVNVIGVVAKARGAGIEPWFMAGRTG